MSGQGHPAHALLVVHQADASRRNAQTAIPRDVKGITSKLVIVAFGRDQHAHMAAHLENVVMQNVQPAVRLSAREITSKRVIVAFGRAHHVPMAAHPENVVLLIAKVQKAQDVTVTTLLLAATAIGFKIRINASMAA